MLRLPQISSRITSALKFSSTQHFRPGSQTFSSLPSFATLPLPLRSFSSNTTPPPPPSTPTHSLASASTPPSPSSSPLPSDVAANIQGNRFVTSGGTSTEVRGTHLGTRYVLIALVGIGMIAAMNWVDTNRTTSQLRVNSGAGQVISTTSHGNPLLGGEFAMTDIDGKVFATRLLGNNFAIIYFGFCSCPDICPFELRKLESALEIVSADQKKAGNEDIADMVLTPVFITIDPWRDTPQKMREHANSYRQFQKTMISITGEYKEILDIAKKFRVYFSPPTAVVEGKAGDVPTEEYLVDHSIFFYLVNGKGECIDYYGKNYTREELVERITAATKKDRRAQRAAQLSRDREDRDDALLARAQK